MAVKNSPVLRGTCAQCTSEFLFVKVRSQKMIQRTRTPACDARTALLNVSVSDDADHARPTLTRAPDSSKFSMTIVADNVRRLLTCRKPVETCFFFLMVYFSQLDHFTAPTLHGSKSLPKGSAHAKLSLLKR